MNLSTVKWAQWDKTQSREVLVCSYVCASHCAQLLHTILHRTDLIVFPLTCQTITTAPMMSIWGKGGYSTCIWRLHLGWPHFRFVEIFGNRKLQFLSDHTALLHDPTFSCFSRTLACNTWTDRHTTATYTTPWRHAVKNACYIMQTLVA